MASITAANPEIVWVDCRDHVPPSDVFDPTGIDLERLPSTLKCGQIVVPMDYSRPLDAGNNITLGLAMHRPPNPKGVIFFSPGGSDNGVVHAWNFALGTNSPFTPNFSGLGEYDLMMMDVRGTYSSNPLDVSLDTVIPLFGPYPASQDEFDDRKAVSAAAIQSWIDSSSPPGIIQHIGTREVVQDFNQIREALRYEQIHYLGGSYGTYRGLQYATTYPDTVGRVVLDAVVPHGISRSQQSKAGIIAANRALVRADAFCQNNSTCPLRDQGKGSVLQTYQEVLEAASNSSAGTLWAIQSTISGLLQGLPDFPLITNIIYQLSLDINFLDTLPQSSVTVEDVVAYILQCADFPTTATFSEFQQSLANALAHDTNNLGRTSGLLIELACSAWPFDRAPLQRLHTEIPILLVTSDFDDLSATEWTTEAFEDLPDAHLLVRHGDGHVSFTCQCSDPSDSHPSSAANVIDTGILPQQSTNESVTVYTPGMERAPVPDAYSVPTGFVAGDVNSE
ncbi:uncharacterized protein A1O9_00499 [Exophiala aquamarina CBS 119918]|uniref:AB hydrolase-1 domain-containing protein n=1 Tax=Exophiala aquamarina CBS 119918 TaxID=1182545 RepID=A0A072PRM4_9EURO|nr:uncharacterized protein A1O9_00499 [Exophiala aquamarina CBS 119918]KEF62526.1 hypothetical protein A1O9_00499 [Exophiala aquamarina CBS 119918]